MCVIDFCFVFVLFFVFVFDVLKACVLQEMPQVVLRKCLLKSSLAKANSPVQNGGEVVRINCISELS